jgi:membrane fusion protein, multidrug efflux system
MDQNFPEPIPPDHQLPSASSGDAAKPSRRRRQWLWILLLLGFAIILVVILRHHDDSAKSAAAAGAGRRGFGGPVTRTIATAQKGDIGVYRDAIGTVTPVYTASIYNQVTGVITEVHYREGQTVQKGDPLVDIDPRQFQAQVESAEGTLQRDTNLLSQAKMDLDRYQKAWERNAIAKQQLDDQKKIVAQDEGLVRSDQGTLDFDKVQLSYCHIVAPFTGRVGLRLVDPGNLVQSSGSTVLAVVTQIQPITVVFTLAQDYLSEVLAQKGRGVGLTVDAFDREQTKKLASGKLLALDNQIDTTTGTVKLRAIFDNRNQALFPNQFVNTRLLVTTEHGVTLIPSSAIQHNGQISFVYVIANGAASLKNVKPGVSDHGVTAVEGINPGDQLATSSFEKLQNGAKVNISKQPLPQDTAESNTP